MGAFFSNLHIRKGENTNTTVIETVVTEYFQKKNLIASDAENADVEVLVYEPANGEWLSVYCDGIMCEDYLAFAPTLSEKCCTDVLTAACFDSDYLFVNLCNADHNTDANLNIGKPYGMKVIRRSNISSWKHIVKDFASFKADTKKDYVCAEDFLSSLSSQLDLPFEQSAGFAAPEECKVLYFAAKSKDDIKPTMLRAYHFDLVPCKPGKRSAFFVQNHGAASKGIAVLFRGDYVKNDEITFEDVELAYIGGHDEWVTIPITLEKCTLGNGECAYMWKDPSFRIPPAVSDDLPPVAKQNLASKRSFGVRYTPYGNKRKFLDITVTLLPLSNNSGLCSWRVWGYSISKRDYIESYNTMKKRFSGMHGGAELLNPDDYDLD